MFNFYEFIRKRWSENSASSGQKGTVVDELAVKPTGLVLSDFYNSLVSQQAINNITNWETMTEDSMDYFGNKFFYPRIDGDQAFGFIRIYFDSKKDILITSDSRAVSTTGLRYSAIQPGTISGNSFKISDESFALYYVDVQILAASKGDAYNIDIGEIVQLEAVDFTYKAVTNVEEISYGTVHETNEEYFNRLKYSISDRSMMNHRSIFARLPEFFPVIHSIYIAGPGDRYMIRDLVSAVDPTEPIQETDYLGKITGENIIKNIGFYQIFPPKAGTVLADTWGPFTIPTNYQYPLTIEASDITNADPAFHGYDLSQECSNDMYQGLYFDDFKNYMEIKTEDLFNIFDEDVGFTDVLIPDSDWIYGAHGASSGDFATLSDGVKPIQVMNFNNNQITLAGGDLSSISINKDIKKRTGIKLEGSFIWPAYDPDNNDKTVDSNLQLMVGGINETFVEGYTGFGFGIRLTGEYKESLESDPTKIGLPNAIIYFAHSEKYGDGQIFATDSDISSHIGITDLGALAETSWRLEPGIEYEFEFVLHDEGITTDPDQRTLYMTLYLKKLSNDNPLDTTGVLENKLQWQLPATVLNAFKQEAFNADSTHYGTMMKVTLDTESIDPDDAWLINDLRAFDISEQRATALLALDVKELESPVSIYLRGYGESSVSDLTSNGYLVYIWDKERTTDATSDTELTAGGWTLLDGLSNPDGSKDVLSTLPSELIQNIERYKVDNKYGTNVFLLITTSGTSKSQYKFSGAVLNDIQAELRVDYAKIQSELSTKYHANNKADIYVSTLRNSKDPEPVTVVLEKQTLESYFEMNSDNSNVPVAEIVSVAIGSTEEETQVLAETEYIVSSGNSTFIGSAQEVIKITLDGYDSDVISVEYRPYPQVQNIQEFFDGPQYQKIFGDILVRHQFPCELSFPVVYTGPIEEDQMIEEIKGYVDSNINSIFSVRELIKYLYDSGFANSIQEPINVEYSKWNDEFNKDYGEFTNNLEIRTVDFFKIDDLTVSKL